MINQANGYLRRSIVVVKTSKTGKGTNIWLSLGVLLALVATFLMIGMFLQRQFLESVVLSGVEKPVGYMAAPKLNLKHAVLPPAKYWAKFGFGLLWATVALCAIPLYKHGYVGGSRWWWLLIPVATLSLEFSGEITSLFKWMCRSTPTPQGAQDFDWSRVVSPDGKLNIKVTTWNTFMLPLVALDQIHRSPFLLPQNDTAQKDIRFIKENEEFQNSDILLLQEVFSPGKNILNNLVEGFWRIAGHPTYGLDTMVQGLKEAGFPYVTDAKMPWWQSFYGFYDSGLVIASKIPFENVKFESYKSKSWLIGFGTCKGILSVEMQVRSPEGERIGTLLIGNTHTEFGTGADFCYKQGDVHPQCEIARKHMMGRLQEIEGTASIIVGGDWNTDNANGMSGFKGTTDAFLAAGGAPENLHSHTDVPPTPVYDASGNPWGSSDDFLKAKLPIEFNYDGCCAWTIDQIFGLDSTECGQRKAVMSEVSRVLMHFKGSTDAEKITENCLTWIRQWNETWIHEGKKGLDLAIQTAKHLTENIMSDHFPITTKVTVDYNMRASADP